MTAIVTMTAWRLILCDVSIVGKLYFTDINTGEDPDLTRRLLATPLIHRLNLGPIPTMRISWDQPHEGNLFEHLWGRRAFQREGSAA